MADQTDDEKRRAAEREDLASAFARGLELHEESKAKKAAEEEAKKTAGKEKETDTDGDGNGSKRSWAERLLGSAPRRG